MTHNIRKFYFSENITYVFSIKVESRHKLAVLHYETVNSIHKYPFEWRSMRPVRPAC